MLLLGLCSYYLCYKTFLHDCKVNARLSSLVFHDELTTSIVMKERMM